MWKTTSYGTGRRAYDRGMFTMANDTELEVRQVLRRMRRLALAFHGSELRLLNKDERRAKVVHVAPVRESREKVAAQA